MNKKNLKLNFNSNQQESYISLNANAKLYAKHPDSYKFDLLAAKKYIEEEINPKFKFFASFKERINFLVSQKYYDPEVISQYSFTELEKLNEKAWSYNHFFPSFMGAFKFYSTYGLKSNDNLTYFEHFPDRVLLNSLFLGKGNFKNAEKILEQIMLGRFQPATPTFLNAGKLKRGEFVSCYLIRVEDNMESISRAITTSLQLSKRGGGVSVLLTNLREQGAPIKDIQNQATGVIPVMKILEDSFSYANQLGQRQGAGAVYLNVHHPDILAFLDTKRENADEKIRIKSLSLGVLIPNITFELAKNNEKMALFSVYDVEKVYKKAFSDISITEKYYEMLENPNIKKTFILARKLFKIIAELHFESGYPYILFEDTVNKENAHPDRVVMSNLCSEITQPSTPSTFLADLSFKKTGQDICCNLGSINIDKAMESGVNFEEMVYYAVLSLDIVSRNSDLSVAPSIEKGNKLNHAIGLGAMNLHGFFAKNEINYDSVEALDFTNIFFYCLAFASFKASQKLAQIYGPFAGFEKTKFATGEYFDKYIKTDPNTFLPKTTTIKELFAKYNVFIPTQKDWIELVKQIRKTGIANSHLMAVAPTGSISYLTSCTPSLQPVVAPVEVRKEGKLGRIYVPSYKLSHKTYNFYQKGAYELGPIPIINIVAEAQKHVDQAISMTLFMTDKATTRDLNLAYIYAFKKGCKSIYYVRIRQDVLENSENYETCQSCVI
ncbi:class 1b ribonucleoside-diphosphate reductase subunit alpha [Mesomycoplasma flocculare]|uniref:Ribonucleoside-diphosphate reductase n=1 Tax=Mesomycoplasma flocculare TaxID=2128 RepID=A0AAW9XAS8_MESFC|nr:class 1b ribonucleoside-diphosphate reductase subunit alpha [Mesomycoplasma flocculare]MXR13670.1 class 1b ribonucleoside-diphosphate reductase subunit alpha [Mesomycoplasma flocculare]MXR22843.1 class 1b ribonucleoside-diphosphate reductase subunit alpha [Mesomycoplasma flocculare]MXR56862.1 class 1b ribonucleoside-diphosphate reductase subunit alpha [Mesomycoplasma flocculare]